MKLLIIGDKALISTCIVPFLDPYTLALYNPDVTIFLKGDKETLKDWTAVVKEVTKSKVYVEDYEIFK